MTDNYSWDWFPSHTRARSTDPVTSHEAAEKIAPRLNILQQNVLFIHRGRPNGLTDYELEALCHSHGSTYRTRRAELTEMGLIVNSGEKRRIAGSNRIVWRLAK